MLWQSSEPEGDHGYQVGHFLVMPVLSKVDAQVRILSRGSQSLREPIEATMFSLLDSSTKSL